MLPINSQSEKPSYEELLVDELAELRNFCGVNEASQVPDYVERDAEDFNIYCTEVQEFSMWGARDTEAHFRFVTTMDGELYLGYVSYKNVNDTFYGILYNPKTDKYSVGEYTRYVRDRRRETTCNLKMIYDEVYLTNSNGEKFYLYGNSYFDSTYYTYSSAAFADWVHNYEGKSNDYIINLLGDHTGKVTTDIEGFIKGIKADKNVGESSEYRYFSMADDRRGICSVCYTKGKYYYMVYFPLDDWYEFYIYDNLYVQKNDDGNVSYILSNIEEDADYEENNVFSDNVSEYLYILPADM